MTNPCRLLTIGFKRSVDEALARRERLQVTSLSHENDSSSSAQLRVMPYEQKSKLSMRAIARVSKTIRAERPDAVMAYGSRPLAHTVLASLGLRSSPKIFSFRGIATAPSKLRAEDWITYLSPRITAHACESQAALDGLASAGVSRERCFLAYNCLTEQPGEPAARSELARFGIPQDAFVVTMVANLRPVKGADLLLRAAIECSELKDTYWLLMGQVRDDRLKRLASDPRIRERVKMPGFVRGAMRFASAADLFVMPSRSEALCVALLEAMSLGVCPVVSDAGGMKEAVRHDQDGVVFPRENVGALASTLRALHADRSRIKRYAESAKSRFRETFTDDAMAERLERGILSHLQSEGRSPIDGATRESAAA